MGDGEVRRIEGVAVEIHAVTMIPDVAFPPSVPEIVCVACGTHAYGAPRRGCPACGGSVQVVPGTVVPPLQVRRSRE